MQQQVFKTNLQEALKCDGDMVEVGVYEGGTSLLIWDMMKDTAKHLYLLDTWDKGLEPTSEDINPELKAGTFKTTDHLVKNFFSNLGRVHIVRGDCMETLRFLGDKKFCFAFIDVDLYKPTKYALQFLLSHMSDGGRIMVHDYPHLVGVDRAVKEVLGGMPSFKDFLILKVVDQIKCPRCSSMNVHLSQLHECPLGGTPYRCSDCYYTWCEGERGLAHPPR